ncbi:hypothetical protein, partial [Aquibium sp. ELW1220]|uniref:hypothetical protein n=1 Tax=Aquibium sp. ELW1220 TaxID=2976766 RepID=UPI0025B22859
MPEQEITSAEDLQKWLADKPTDWAQAIAVRAALRVLPLPFPLFDDRGRNPGTTDFRVIILQTFRATSISWAARKYPAHEMSADAAAAAAYAADAAAARAAYAAADAAYAAA